MSLIGRISVDVLEPASMRTEIRDELKKMQKIYETEA